MIERARLAPDLETNRILNGLWQVSGAHGRIDPAAAVEAMFAYHDAGFTTWDMADHYGPAEDFAGEFRRRLLRERGEQAAAEASFFTKWVPQPMPMLRPMVERAVQRSLQRLGVERIDLLQFHWWDYDDDGYLEALRHLHDLRNEGLIRYLGLTNFDTEHLGIIVDQGIPIVANQVQYSLIDRRPALKMAPYCAEHGIGLLAYGTLAGGLLTDRFLNAREPGSRELDTASLRKYKQMIDAWGGWSLFQELLGVLDGLARAKACSIANLAVRYVLDKPAVAGVIVGARLGVAEHIADNARAFDVRLSADELAAIDAVLDRGSDLFRLIGDCGDEYRH